MSLRSKIIYLFVILSVVVISMFFGTCFVVNNQKNDGMVINLSGRQRMLSQKMTKEVLNYYLLKKEGDPSAKEVKESLTSTMKVFDITLKSLKDSGEAPISTNLKKTEYRQLPKAKGESYTQLAKVQELWTEFSSKTDLILQGKDADSNLKWVLDNNQNLLSEMNAAVKLLQEESEQKVSSLLIFQFFSVILLVSLTVLAFLFISRKVINPIEVMTNSIAKDSNGNIQVKEINIESKDEIGVLGKTLNILSSQVKSFIQSVIASIENINSNSNLVSTATFQATEGIQQICETTNQMAAGAQDQADSVQNCLSEVNDITSELHRVSKNADKTVQLADSAKSNAGYGKEQSNEAVETINQVKTITEETAQRINNLGNLSSEIGMIVELIKNIAAQTNLLALNAAIEAARAGEHGKGFAIVAEEVKKLAGESADATDKITEMIGEIQVQTESAISSMSANLGAVDKGVLMVQNVEKALDEIVKAIDNVDINIEEVSGYIQTSVEKSDNLTQTMVNISAIIQEYAASTQELSASTEEQTASFEEISASIQILADVAEKLREQVAKFNF